MTRRRGRQRQRRKPGARLRVRAPLVVLVLVVLYWGFGEWLRGPLGLPGSGSAPTKAGFRVVTWNLRNFPEPKQDLSRFDWRWREFSADLVAVQEVNDPVALQRLLPDWQMELSEQGGRGRQRLGIAFNPQTVELLTPLQEHRELTMSGRVRPAVSAYVRARGGPEFHVMVVHLKATPDGYATRQQQWSELVALIKDLLRRDPDLILLGDFNSTGPQGGTADDELYELGKHLEPLGLRRLTSPDPCSAYWDGPRRDAWKEPSLLDLVWVAGLHEAIASDTQITPLHHCARHRCQSFRSTPAHPEPDYTDLSDHCPVVVDFSPAGAA